MPRGTNRIDPRDDQRGFRQQYRWPERCRVLMVAAVLSKLTWAEQQAVSQGADLPNHSTLMAPMYLQLVQDVHAVIDAEAGELVNHKPSARSIKEAAQKWTKRFLREGSVHDAPPHLPGHNIQRLLPVLTAMKDVLMQGYLDALGQTMVFKSLQDACSKSEAFADLYQQTGYKSYRSCWKNLRKAFPQLCTVELRVKKCREAALVQACTIDLLQLDGAGYRPLDDDIPAWAAWQPAWHFI